METERRTDRLTSRIEQDLLTIVRQIWMSLVSRCIILSMAFFGHQLFSPVCLIQQIASLDRRGREQRRDKLAIASL